MLQFKPHCTLKKTKKKVLENECGMQCLSSMKNIFRWHSWFSGQRAEQHWRTWRMWTSCIPSQWVVCSSLGNGSCRRHWRQLACAIPLIWFPFLPAAMARNTSQTPCCTRSETDRLPGCRPPPGCCLVSGCSCTSSEGRWPASRGRSSLRTWALAAAGRARRRLSTAGQSTELQPLKPSQVKGSGHGNTPQTAAGKHHIIPQTLCSLT